MRKLFTIANPKTAKGGALGYHTIVLHLAPGDLSGVNVCPMASAGCLAACLNRAGRGRFDNVQRARIQRTEALMACRDLFVDRLSAEITANERHAMEDLGMTLAVRINGTSDLPGLARKLAGRHPSVQFYDYTKIPGAILAARDIPNLHYTFSRSEGNEDTCGQVIAWGENVTVVFDTRKGDALPATWYDVPVIDGDEHDLRFLDPRGVVVGLRAKGPARNDTSGFVVATEAA